MPNFATPPLFHEQHTPQRQQQPQPPQGQQPLQQAQQPQQPVNNGAVNANIVLEHDEVAYPL